MAALDYLRQVGLSVEVVCGKLRITPARQITDAVRHYIREHRAQLLIEAANDSLVHQPNMDHLPAVDTPEAELIADDHPRHIIHTAATASPEWIAARDDYHNHIFGCRDCYAPLSRYCATGADLRQRYDGGTQP
jgi:hypothetical protein